MELPMKVKGRMMQKEQVLSGQLAIDGGEPVRTDPFPSWPVFDDREERMLLEVLRSGKWGELTGDKVTTFASRFAAYQGWGAEWSGVRVGALGDLGCFSFQAGKNINAGEGGIVITNDSELAELCWSLHNVGRVRGGEWYQHEILGWNFRMTEWQGAVLLAQLDRL